MKGFPQLDPSLLRRRCDPKKLPFKTTSELKPLGKPLGQCDALDALRLGANIRQNGFHIFAMGPAGTQKKELIDGCLKSCVNGGQLHDWCYIHNFKDNSKPIALALDPGYGKMLKRDMNGVIELGKKSIPQEDLNQTFELLRKKYDAYPNVLTYLNFVKKDMQNNPNRDVANYQVNLLVNNAKQTHRPIIYEDDPEFDNLIGRIEYEPTHGALTTNFMNIKPGSLHRANGGFLIIDAVILAQQTFALDALKRMLKGRYVNVESFGQKLGFISNTSLDPEPIDLNVKIILLGNRPTYYALCENDPEFNTIFHITVDFEHEIERTPAQQINYARWVGDFLTRQNLLPMDNKAVSLLIEHASRLSGDNQKLSLLTDDITKLMAESDYIARSNNRKHIRQPDLSKAIENNIRRKARLQRTLYEEIHRGIVWIDTQTEKVGQINALTVIQTGDYHFGAPSRITATTHLGKGDVINIERETELSGPVHSKGILIMEGYLSANYAPERPLSLSASIVFEQTYESIDGDSASAAELCALLSSLSFIPIKQSIAITGAIDQFGYLQAIGGVNEKIESFFDICKENGLHGDNGVIIPSVNVTNLMLREDIVAAAAKNLFHIYPVDTIDEAITILTGINAGKRGKNGLYPKNTINYLVESRLLHYANLSEGEHKD